MLAGFGLLVCGLAAALLMVAGAPVIAAVLAPLAAAAAADLGVVVRRELRGEPG